MLSRLYISNYALIDSLEIDFRTGLTIITGETGAGKSIILGALSSILGERADAKSIRNADMKSVIEGVFDITQFDLGQFFSENDIECFGEECIVRREILPNGRTRAFVNDSPVSLAILKDLAIQLVDIHSQHNNLLLSKSSYQLKIIDSIAGNKTLLDNYKQAYASFVAANKELEVLKASIEKKRTEEDYIRFQLNQFAELNLQPDEDKTLVAKHSRLANANEIKETLWTLKDLLNDSEGSVIENLFAARNRLNAISNKLPEANPLEERVSTSIIELRDIFNEIVDLNEQIECDPEQLERVEERLDAIYSLERKHNVNNVDDLLALQKQMQNAINEIDNSEELLQEKQKIAENNYQQAIKLAAELSKIRKTTAATFASQLESMARGLALQNIKFEVKFTDTELKCEGIDNVSFMVAFNKQQDLMPVETTASGGEISRLMLCIKAIVAKSMNLPTVIFDEIDTGVSGEVASKIGSMMLEMSQNLQVMAITHLPQVAAKGKHHYKVYKTDTATSTVTSLKPLNEDERVTEIAAMLSGDTIGAAAIENAKTLLAQTN